MEALDIADYKGRHNALNFTSSLGGGGGGWAQFARTPSSSRPPFLYSPGSGHSILSWGWGGGETRRAREMICTSIFNIFTCVASPPSSSLRIFVVVADGGTIGIPVKFCCFGMVWDEQIFWMIRYSLHISICGDGDEKKMFCLIFDGSRLSLMWTLHNLDIPMLFSPGSREC